ncbi:hypothetical protein NDI44_23150 [Trichocoleus sp. DQ-A3]
MVMILGVLSIPVLLWRQLPVPHTPSSSKSGKVYRQLKQPAASFAQTVKHQNF